MTSLMVSGMDGREDSLSGVVFTSCTAFGPLIRKFSNSSSEAGGKESVGACEKKTTTIEFFSSNNIQNLFWLRRNLYDKRGVCMFEKEEARIYEKERNKGKRLIFLNYF